MKGRDLLTLKAELQIHSNVEMANRLGIGITMFQNRLNLPDEDVPEWLAMAAAAVRAGLEPYRPGYVSQDALVYYNRKSADRVYRKLLTQEETVKEDRS
jgi:hypothetical protein